MHVTVISPEASMFDGDADAVTAPAYDGEVGILPGHAAFMTLLGRGRLRIRRAGVVSEFTLAGGFLQVVDDRVRVVAEHVQGVTNAA
jgi:F-type H+-transporting ATPase subunit epsilon